MKEFADFLEAHGGRREAVTDPASTWGGLRSGIKENFQNAEITFNKSTSSSSPTRRSTRCGARRARPNFQIKGRRYIFLKNVDHLTQEEKEALSGLEAQNLDTIQAMQIP